MGELGRLVFRKIEPGRKKSGRARLVAFLRGWKDLSDWPQPKKTKWVPTISSYKGKGLKPCLALWKKI